MILTGMGSDGAPAMERLHRLGAETIAESEETAVIHGMPEAVISPTATAAGSCVHDAEYMKASHMDLLNEWRDRLVIRIGDRVDVSTSALLSVVRPITSAEEKRELHRRTAAGAVDMESAAIAAVAIQSGISFLAVRVVVDAAAVSIPKAALGMFDEGGRLKKSSLIRFVLHPLGWPGLIVLARANAAAGRSMRSLWSAAGPDLGLS